MFAVIYIPDFSLQAALRLEPELFLRPVALLDEDLKVIFQMTNVARSAGVTEGLVSTQALARCPSILICPRSTSLETSTTDILLQSAYAFSPNIEATAPGICTLDLQGLPVVGVEVTRLNSSTENESPRNAKESAADLQSAGAKGKTLVVGTSQTAKRSIDTSFCLCDVPARAVAGGTNISKAFEGSNELCCDPARTSQTTNPTTSPQHFRQWAEKIITALTQLNLRARIGIAENPDLALHAAKMAQPFFYVENSNQFISSLSIASIDPPPEILTLLERWGIHTLGEFIALQKSNLVERLGAEVIDLFDKAIANSIRPLNLVKPREVFEETMEFENEIETLEPLLFVMRRFLEQISRRLELFYFVAEEIQLRLTLSNGDKHERVFRVPAPTRNVETLFRMLQTHLETVRTDSTIVALQLAAKPGRSEQFQFGLFETSLRDPNQFFETLAQLTSVVGSDRVGSPVLENSYRPDAFRMERVDFESEKKSASRTVKFEISTLPLHRFRPPLPVIVEMRGNKPVLLHSDRFVGPITKAHGPFRRSGHWWENEQSWSRDEWDIETRDGELFRIFIEKDQWFLEGVFD